MLSNLTSFFIPYIFSKTFNSRERVCGSVDVFPLFPVAFLFPLFSVVFLGGVVFRA